MASELILITGTTGFIGIKILGLALNAGYHVRAPVRSEAKGHHLRSNKFIASFAAGARLETPVIEDITVDGAFDEVLKSVTFVIHTASTLPGQGLAPEEFNAKLIKPARMGTTSLLYSAIKTPSVKRVVITSSGAAVVEWKYFFRESTDKVYTANDRAPFETEYPDGDSQAYSASKVAALAATEDFIEKEKPHFDVVTLIPGFVFGRNETADSVETVLSGSNRLAFGQVLGNKTNIGPSVVCHVDDVAAVHLKAATDLSIPGNRAYAISSGPPGEPKIADALDVVKKYFPERVADGTLPCTGFHDSQRVLLDASETERVFGMKFKPYEEGVKDFTAQYLEFLDASSGAKTTG
ncbi:NAD(P)-binding protein [Mytilinidion resinicola]|uniref:NAD(P)-binding protein n=1 Tax=Mytilinidion resinicola TaxID=574789 RepID=A0A6A6YFG5_9PEZI|nr:NAD(P)-binding protein [Mytilinidion resinicola]KAF2807273.1 NAD(P)-binding protein [Mytilinidion resinicola]